MFYFIFSFQFYLISPSQSGKEHSKKNSECLVEFYLQGLLSKMAVRHSAQLSLSQGTIETDFHAQTLRGEEPAKTMALQAR